MKRLTRMPSRWGLLTLCTLSLHAEAALDCSALVEWQNGQTHVAGDRVQYLGKAYQANWWTQTNPAENSAAYQDWSYLDSCDSVVINNPPVLSNLLPVDASSYSENDSVIFSVDASDSDGLVAKVEFSVDGTVIATDSSAPFETSWLAVTGSHTLSAVATDDLGALSDLLAAHVSVTGAQSENQPPSASLSLSGAPLEIYPGDGVTFNLNGSDADGSVTGMSLAIDNSEVYSTTSASAAYVWQAGAAGSYDFVLTVTDDKGARGSGSLRVTVSDATTPAGDCHPAGLYRTPGVSTPYCTVYDENGREKMGADHPRRIIGYFTGWRTGKNGQPAYLADDIPWDKVTHINYAFAHVDAGNRVSIGDPNAANNAATNMQWPGVSGAEMDPSLPYKGHFNLLNKYKKLHPNVKTLVSVGGWAETGGYFDGDGNRVASGGFYTMTTNADGSVNSAGINTFAQSAVAFIRSYGFDGVDIDYEYPSSMKDSGHPDDFAISNARRAGLNASYKVLLKTLREELDKAGAADGRHYLLTIASPSSGYLLRGMETFEAVKYLDYVNVMSYDLHGAWNSHVGHNAALYDTGKDSELAQWKVYDTAEFEGIGYLNTDWAVRYFRGALAAGRINIGIPYYTRGFQGVSGGDHGLWGQAALPDQSACPAGTGVGDNNQCGFGAEGIDNLWHDKNEVGEEVPAGSNPLWHVKNLQNAIVPDYLTAYGLDPQTDPADVLSGSYTRYYDSVAVAPWLWNEQKQVFISIEDEESMATKVDYVINQGLGGIMFWELAGDFDYNGAKGQYETGSSMTSLAFDRFRQSGTAYDTRVGNVNFSVPAEAVDVAFEAKDFPVGDDNYPIAPTFAFTNNSALDLSGAKIAFDVPVSTSAVFKSNWNAQEKLGMAVETNGANAAGNNIGGFENEFHRFSVTLVNEWGGAAKSFAPGETVGAEVMYYLPITGPANFTIEKDGKVYAFKSEYPMLPDAQPDTGGGTGGTGGTGSDTCEGTPIADIHVYPNWPQVDWAGNPDHANTGDLMINGSAVYKAKWWTNTEPGTSADWDLACNL